MGKVQECFLRHAPIRSALRVSESFGNLELSEEYV